MERQGQHNKASDKDNNSTNGTTTSLDRSTAAASHNAKNINKSSAYNATGQENRSLMKDLALSLDAAASRYASQNFGVRGGVVRSSLSQEIKNSSLKNSYYHIQSALQKQPKRDEKTNCEFNLSSSNYGSRNDSFIFLFQNQYYIKCLQLNITKAVLELF